MPVQVGFLSQATERLLRNRIKGEKMHKSKMNK